MTSLDNLKSIHWAATTKTKEKCVGLNYPEGTVCGEYLTTDEVVFNQSMKQVGGGYRCLKHLEYEPR